MSERRSILLLCDESTRHAGNVRQHIAALKGLSRHSIHAFDPIDSGPASAWLDLREFDVVAIHYTVTVWLDRYLPAVLAQKISAFQGLTVQFIQDEYRVVDQATARMRELGVDVLFTCVPERTIPEVYGDRLPGVRTISVLPGYVPDELVGRSVPASARRPIDVGYRARTVPPWLGRLGQDKVEIGRGFLERAGEYGLKCDISWHENDRIYGEAWNRFLESCRATLGTESGSSIVDFDGSLQDRSKEFFARDPDASFEAASSTLLAPYEGAVVINTASPRIFEAAALRTALVLFPGEYAGVVMPDVHYIPLEKSFSNMDAVVERLRDQPALEAMIERAYGDLIASGRYSLRQMVQQFDDVVSELSQPGARAGKDGYRRASLRRKLPSVRGSRLRVAAGRSLNPLAAVFLVARDDALRKVAVKALRSRLAGTGSDLLRLTALRNGLRRGSLVADVDLDAERRLLFVSTRPAGTRAGSRNGAQIVRALEAGEVDTIVWNHSLVDVSAGLSGGRLLAIRVGDHGVEGAHSFKSLAALAALQPELVIEVLEPLLAGPEPEAR